MSTQQLIETMLTPDVLVSIQGSEELLAEMENANCYWPKNWTPTVNTQVVLPISQITPQLIVEPIILNCSSLPVSASLVWDIQLDPSSSYSNPGMLGECTGKLNGLGAFGMSDREQETLLDAFCLQFQNSVGGSVSNHHQLKDSGHPIALWTTLFVSLSLVVFGMAKKSVRSLNHSNDDGEHSSNQTGLDALQTTDASLRDPLLQSGTSIDLESSTPVPVDHFLQTAYDSIASSKVVPQAAKVAFPILIVGSILLFLSSNLSVGAAVSLNFGIGSFSIDPIQIFAFSLGNTIHDMLQAKVYALAILVLVWSGMWPYLKLVLMLVCWTFPCSRGGEVLRGKVLHVLDALGKWCMIDIFLLLMMTVAFRFHVSSSTIPSAGAFFPPNFVLVDVDVLPGYGIFGFVTAAIVSLVTSHMAVAYHRNTFNYKFVDASAGAGAVPAELSSQHPRVILHQAQASENPARFRQRRPSGSSVSNVVVRNRSGSSSSSSTVVTIVDDEHARRRFFCPCPRFSWFDKGSVERQGRIGSDGVTALPVTSADGEVLSSTLALESVYAKEALFVHRYNEPETHERALGRNVAVSSLLVLATVLVLWGAFLDSFEFVFTGLAGQLIEVVDPGAGTRSFSMITIATALSADGSNAGIVFLQSVYLGFAFVFPLIQIIFLIALWFAPMTLRDMKIVLYTAEVISAWSSIDVFIVSLIASVVEIDQFARFLIGDRCDIIEAVVQEHCFGVTTTLLSGCWVVFSAAFVLLVVTQIILSLAQQAISERESRSIASVAG